MPKRARDDQSRAVDTFERPKVQFLNFIYPLIWLVITLILYETIFESAYKLEWVNRWSCVVATSLVCYGLLAIYHFLKMVLSCLVDLTLTGNTLGRNAFKALYLVCRYHLGTACYRATLIFPRIHATIVVNEQASIERLQLSAARRFYLTHWHIYNLSTTVSGARGYNHSESIRETWRFFVKHPDKLHNFQIFKHLHKYFFIILMMTNNLMFIFLWIHGAIIDPRFPTGTWVAYIIGYFLSLILLNWLDTVFDVIRFQEANKTIFTELL
ncbi:uncharacterized protein LOC131663196 [Phymastichus coffea]|uniref:uncharacterized protein LOC131663196 n=1 Tax=Phymastichus coffea TaxID=108790 RepID=UPI00273A8BE7|nr:uncharacterized protein LOC131663196 [Phymastichus coffea]